MENKVILSIGCNKDCDIQMQRVRECLKRAFPDARFTAPLLNPAYDTKKDSSVYSNMLAEFTTPLPEDALLQILKKLEIRCGNTYELRSQGIVMMDLDIMQYNEEKRHSTDWSRPYIQALMKVLPKILLVIFLLTNLIPHPSTCNAQTDDAKILLSKAIEYYTGGKYHECILTFNKLQKSYRLNARYTAYLGYSYYKEGEYKDAVTYLEAGIPKLTAFSPFEQASYIYACAESYFNLQQYKESLPWYNKVLPLVEGLDKGDVFYHTGFADYMTGDNKTALINLQKADSIYADSIYGANLDKLHIARKAQTTTMLKALKRDNAPEPDILTPTPPKNSN